MIKISIITVTYNAYDALKRTIDSIRKNKKKYQSYYIIDGASTDNTIRLINENKDVIDDFISEKDYGIYDAMNKSILFPHDDNTFLIWINAGDELLEWDDNEIHKIRNYDCAFFAVNTKLSTTDKGKQIKPFFTLPFGERNFIGNLQMWHQGYFIKYSLFNKIKYDLSVGIQADRLLMYYTAMNFKYYLSEMATANYYLDGISSTNHKLYHQSMINVAKRLNFNMIKLCFWHPRYFLKSLIKPYLPISFFNYLRKFRLQK